MEISSDDRRILQCTVERSFSNAGVEYDLLLRRGFPSKQRN